MNSGTLDPGTGDLTAAGINASQELFPASQSTEDGVDYVQFNGLSALTGGGQAYTIGENSVILPVELLEYNAQLIDDKVLSSWITATEINSDYFEVEQSSDKASWQKVGTVEAAGNSNSELYYQLFDEDPLKGVSYYRLKSVDQDASFTYSQVEIVSISLESSLALIYPNPNTGTFNVSLTDPSAVESIEIYSATGQLVKRIVTNSRSEFTVSGISNGYYNLSIIGANERFVAPIIVSE